MSYTLNGISLGEVQSERSYLTSGFDKENYAMSSSKSMEAIDEGNTQRTITLRGRYVGSSKTAVMNDFVQPIDSLQTGDQRTVVYHSDDWDLTTSGDYTDGNFSVKVESFEVDIKIGDICFADYTLVLIESI